MSPKLKEFLLRWVNNTVAVFLAACIVSGIHYDNALGLVAATLLLGILNTFVRPLLMFLSLPLVIFTLGLFTFVINALLLYAVGSLMNSFHVDSFKAAFWGGLIISFISFVLNSLTGTNRFRVQVRRGGPPPGPPSEGGGPVIDV